MSTGTLSFTVPKTVVYLDNSDDTFGTGGNDWIIDSLSDRTFMIRGYDIDDITKYGVPFGTILAAMDLPYNKTFILDANKDTVIGE